MPEAIPPAPGGAPPQTAAAPGAEGPAPVPGESRPFPSLSALKAEHRALLARGEDDRFTDDALARVTTFLHRGAATGGLLELDPDRQVAHNMLDYWVTVLYRAGASAPARPRGS